jgi:hypothetical protein
MVVIDSTVTTAATAAAAAAARDVTITPRQRIQTYREITRLRGLAAPSQEQQKRWAAGAGHPQHGPSNLPHAALHVRLCHPNCKL